MLHPLLLLQAAKQRGGIPQYSHPHALAMGGLEAMKTLLPGFQEEVGAGVLMKWHMRFLDQSGGQSVSW